MITCICWTKAWWQTNWSLAGHNKHLPFLLFFLEPSRSSTQNLRSFLYWAARLRHGAEPVQVSQCCLNARGLNFPPQMSQVSSGRWSACIKKGECFLKRPRYNTCMCILKCLRGRGGLLDPHNLHLSGRPSSFPQSLYRVQNKKCWFKTQSFQYNTFQAALHPPSSPPANSGK